MNKREELLERIKHLPAEKQAALFKQLDVQNTQMTIPVVDSQGAAPASYGQAGLWNVYEIEGKNDKYNMPSAYQLRGSLDVEALIASFKYVVARHESLRTSFVKKEGELYQTVHSPDSFDVTVVDFQNMPEDEQTQKAYDLIESTGGYVFDLETGPLFIATLILIAEDYHILLLCAHHIIFDGRSKGVLLKELRECYEQYSNKDRQLTQPLLPELPIQYTDFAHWERQQGYLDEQVEFWQKKLKDSPHHLNIGDKERVKGKAANGFSVPIKLNATLAEQLKLMGRKAGCSPYMTMLATFALALSRYAQQEEVLIGTPIENRRQQELSGLIGYFLNTTVMDIYVDENNNFIEYLRAVKKTCSEAYSKQDAPFNRVVEAVNPVRSLNVSPLFQAMFVFQVAGASEFKLPGVEVKQIDSEKVDIRDLDKALSGSSKSLNNDEFVEFKSHTKFDLYLTFIEETDGSFGGWLTYDKSLMSQDYIRNFLVNYVNFLETIVDNSSSALYTVPMMTSSDTLLLDGINETEYETDNASTLVSEFERQVEETPDSAAILFQEKITTFDQLNTAANQLAHYLLSLEIERGDIIAVAMTRSLEAITAMLAVLKVGGVYLPLDPKLPMSRVEQYLLSAKAKKVLSLSQEITFRPKFMNSADILQLDTLANQLTEFPEQNPGVELSSNQAAYLLYTSGSTGIPKGVMGTHDATLNRLSWMWREYPYQKNEVLCHKTACSFVDAVAEIWGGLLQGVPLVIVPDEKVLDLYDFVTVLKDQRVTRLTLVPSLLLSMLDHYPELGESLPELSLVVCSGEALQEDLVRRFYEAFDSAQLLNLYGSTEVAADATFYPVPATTVRGSSIPIGKPIDNCEVYVLDRYLNRSPAGVAGELFIGGRAVALSYYGDPRLTAEKFIPNPCSSSGERLFRTSDQVQLHRNGQLNYLGRKDNQIKLRGFRIHLDEIQNQLNQNESVKGSVVVFNSESTDESAVGEGVLIAYIIQEDTLDEPLTIDKVRMYLREHLPDYMVPKFIEFVSEFPLLDSGKIDRKNLPEPDYSQLSSVTYIEPKNDTEKQLVEIWQRLLKVPKIGTQDNFFDLGGHSIVAAQVSAEIRKSFKLDIHVQDVFNFLTVAEFGYFLDNLSLAQSLSSVSSESENENSDHEVYEF
jgi:amino acid adenylation domain-containing protein